MKVKYGSIIVAGSGKIGGHVASRNRGGAYMRTKVTPVNPSSSYQSAVRSILTTISQAWRGLTQTQRNAWNNAVSSFAKSDQFGDLKTPAGFNLFQRLNNNIIRLGGTLINTPPVPAALDEYSAPVLTYASGTPALSLAFTAVAGTDTGYIVEATPPLQPGKGFFKNDFRIITVAGTTASSPLNILTAYTTRFGSVGAVGTKIAVRITPCGADSGIKGQGAIAVAIAAS